MDKFGKYEVVERIAAGGFGEVFKGYDPMIKRSVAIKICKSDDEQTRRRFELEAEIAGNLSHRNITTIYDYGIEDGTPYLVQELLDGEDLDRKIKRREAISRSVKLAYLAQIASGLEHSHDNGVLHRDLKPANIHVLADGTAKIMDYGVARLLNQDSDLTSDGETVGTTAYLAPEQIHGEDLDHRVDVFAFGTVSYELLTYERAFRGDTVSSLMYQIISAEPESIRTYWRDCPADLMNLVERCLEKEPDRRPQDFSVIVGELSRMRESSASQELPIRASSQSSSPTSSGDSSAVPSDMTDETLLMSTSTVERPTRRRGVLVGVGGVVLAAVGVAAWLGSRSDSVERVTEPPALVEEAAAADAESAAAQALPVSPEGTAAGTPEPSPTSPPSAESPGNEAPGSLPPPSRPSVRTAQEKPAAPVIETFELASDPPGARIWVDGRRLAVPASVELMPGASYRLRLELEGYESIDRSLSLESLSTSERSNRRVSVAMARRARPRAEPTEPEPTDPGPTEPELTDRELAGTGPAGSEQRKVAAEAGSGVPTQPPSVETTPPAAPARETPAAAPGGEPEVALAAIREILDSYEEAYAALDVTAVRRLWPSIDTDRRARLEESFSSLRAAGLGQTVELDCRKPTLDGDRASVSCSQIVTVTSANQRMNTAESELDIDLEKVDGSWVIRSVRSR